MNVVNTTFNTAGIVSLIISVVLPLFVALVTKQTWPRDVKGIMLLFLSALTAFFSQWAESLANDSRFDWKPIAADTAINFILATVAYYGIWKGGPVQTKLAQTGVAPKREGTVDVNAFAAPEATAHDPDLEEFDAVTELGALLDETAEELEDAEVVDTESLDFEPVFAPEEPAPPVTPPQHRA